MVSGFPAHPIFNRNKQNGWFKLFCFQCFLLCTQFLYTILNAQFVIWNKYSSVSSFQSSCYLLGLTCPWATQIQKPCDANCFPFSLALIYIFILILILYVIYFMNSFYSFMIFALIL